MILQTLKKSFPGCLKKSALTTAQETLRIPSVINHQQWSQTDSSVTKDQGCGAVGLQGFAVAQRHIEHS